MVGESMVLDDEITLDELKEAMRELVWTAIGYVPTAVQDAFHKHMGRLRLVAGGVRAGKSNSTAMDFAGEFAVEDGLIWIVGPDYEQCKPEFDYLYAAFDALGLIVDSSTPDKGSRHFTITNGCKVQTKSSDDTRSLASFAPHAILMVEAGQQSYEIYLKVIERALEWNAKVVLSGTFEGANSWYTDMFLMWQGPNLEDGKSFSMPSWSNHFKFPGGRQDPKILAMERSMPEELFAERCGAVPYKAPTLVHKAFDHAIHVADMDYEEDWNLEIAVDPAQHTYAVLAIQWKTMNLLEWWLYDNMKTGTYKDREEVPLPEQFTKEELHEQWTRIRVIDEVYKHDIEAQNIIPLVKERPWWKHVKKMAGVIDIAGTHREGNKSQVQIWREEAKVNFRWKYCYIHESIAVVNLRLQKTDPLGVPLIQFSSKLNQGRDMSGRANGIIAEFGLYKRPQWSEGQSTTDKPIDANNDACKALGYFLFWHWGPVVERKKAKAKVYSRAYSKGYVSATKRKVS